jgi:tetratricopeptide (TPR) repeat protein
MTNFHKNIDNLKRKKSYLPLLAILALSSAVYLNTLQNGFVFDDAYQVLGNEWIKDIKNIPEIFTENAWGFSGQRSNYYRPVMHLIYMFDYHIFGLKPWGFHLVNIVFHSGTSVLVFLTAKKLFETIRNQTDLSLAPPFWAAVLFSANPIHTEAVAWVGGVTDLSVSFSLLLSFLFYMYATREERFSYPFYFISLGGFALALLSKETALTFPVILAVYDISLKEKKRPDYFSGLLKRYTPFFIVLGIYLILRVNALGAFFPSAKHEGISVFKFLINTCYLFAIYIYKLVLPVNLNAFHSIKLIESPLEINGLISIALAFVFAACLGVSFKRDRAVFFCLLIIVIPLLPALYFPAIEVFVFAERYLYLPSFGFAMLFSALYFHMAGKGRRQALFLNTAFLILTAVYFAGTTDRNAVWKDDYALWSDTVKKSPDASLPHYNLGTILLSMGKDEEAMAELKKALALNPKNPKIYHNMGVMFYKRDMFDEAMKYYESALKLHLDSPEIHKDYGLALWREGLLDEAAGHFEEAVRLNPRDAKAHFNLGRIYLKKGLKDMAQKELKEALDIEPGYGQAKELLMKL